MIFNMICFIGLYFISILSFKYSLEFFRGPSEQLQCGRLPNMQWAYLLWRAFHVTAAEDNQPEINPFHVVTLITVKQNVILTLGIRVACNQARVMLFKCHHFVRFQLFHTIGGFMMTGAWVKPISGGYQNRVAPRNQSTSPPLLIIQFGCLSLSRTKYCRILWRIRTHLKSCVLSFFYASYCDTGSPSHAIVIKL